MEERARAGAVWELELVWGVFKEERRENEAERGIVGAFWEGKKEWRVGREGKVWMETASSEMVVVLLAVVRTEEDELALVSDADVERRVWSLEVRLGEGWSDGKEEEEEQVMHEKR